MAKADPRHTLGDLVAQRRRELRLTKEEAARRVPMSSISWKRVEDGLPVRETTYTGVENVLEWPPGSIQRFLATAVAPMSPMTPAVDPATAPVEAVAEMLMSIRKALGEEVFEDALHKVKQLRERERDRTQY